MTKHMMLAASALALAACGQTTTVETPPPPVMEAPQPAAMTDADFAQAVANADAFEIQSSQLAASRASRAAVKTFATNMVRDHTATTTELTTLAPTINLTAPTPMMDAAHQATLDSLRALSGAAFDTAYIAAQTQAHQDAISTFESYVSTAPAGPLKDWANTTLPKLRTHLTDVQALATA